MLAKVVPRGLRSLSLLPRLPPSHHLRARKVFASVVVGGDGVTKLTPSTADASRMASFFSRMFIWALKSKESMRA